MKKKVVLLFVFIMLLFVLGGCDKEETYDMELLVEDVTMCVGEQKELSWEISVDMEGESDPSVIAEKKKTEEQAFAGGGMNFEIQNPEVIKIRDNKIIALAPGETEVHFMIWHQTQQQPTNGVKARNELLLQTVFHVFVS